MNKKILFLYDSHPDRAWTRDRQPCLMSAADRSGLNIHFEDIYSVFGKEVAEASDNFLRRSILYKLDINSANQEFIDYLVAGEYAYVIFATVDNYREWLSIELLEKIKALDITTIGYLGDDEFNYHQNEFFAALFDGVVVYTEFALERYSNLIEKSKIFLLPNCACGVDRSKILEDEIKCDLVIIGAPIANRKELIAECLENGVIVEIYGSDSWLQETRFFDSYKGYAPSNDFNQIIKRGRFYLSPLEDHISGALHMNTKIWEAARGGRVPICTYYGPLESLYKFEIGSNIEVYRSSNDVPKIIKKYKKNLREYESYRNKFLKHVFQNWDYEDQYLKFFNWLPSVRQHEVYNSILERVCAAAALSFSPEKCDVYFDCISRGKIMKQFPILVTSGTVFNCTNELLPSSRGSPKHIKILLGNVKVSAFQHYMQRSLGYLYSRELYWVTRNRLLNSKLLRRPVAQVMQWLRR